METIIPLDGEELTVEVIRKLSKTKFISCGQGCGSGSAWIRIHFTSWIRIRIQYVDPDPGGKIFQIKTEKGKEIANNCNFIQFLK